MDQKTLVIEQIEDGMELVRRFDRFAPLGTAVWLRPADSARWSLYLVSEQITSANLRSGYGELVRLAGELHEPELGLFRAKLVPADSPIARDALEACRYYRPGRIIDFGVRLFGDLPMEEGYFYPLPACMPAK